MQWLWAAVSGFLVGAILGPLFEPWARRLARAGRRVAREPALDIHVEWDQAVIWAGWPPWLSFAHYFVGTFPDEPPPDSGFDWSRWADRHGGYDFRFTMLQITLIARADTTVVIGTPIVTQRISEVPEGVAVVYPAPGGPDVNPRRYDIDLSSGERPRVTFRDAEARDAEVQQPKPSPSWSLQKGEVEQLAIWANAAHEGLHEWEIELPLLVDGRRRKLRIDKNGGPFVTVGKRQPYNYFIRHQDRWEPTLP